MKRLRTVLLWVLVSALVIFIALSVTVALFGKKILVGQIEKRLNIKLSFESISFSLPLSVKVTKLEAGDILKADLISISPSLTGLFSGKIVLNNLSMLNPQITLIQKEDGSLNIPQPESETRGAVDSSIGPESKKPKAPAFVPVSLKIENGRFTFIDKKVLPEGFQVIADKMNIDIQKSHIPLSLNTKFNIIAVLIDPKERPLGEAHFNGWVDFGSKDMDGALEIKNLDVLYFKPYYGDFLSKRKLVSARLNLRSQFNAEDNDLTVASNLRLFGLAYGQGGAVIEENIPSFDLASNALDLFTDKQGNLDLEFSLKTELDNPKISAEELKKTVLEAAMRNLSNQPPQDLIEKITDKIKQFKEFGEGLEGIFKR